MEISLEEFMEKYPIGSKLVGSDFGFNQYQRSLSCKVVGYSKFSAAILVYNPEIDGHSGNGVCTFDGEVTISDVDMHLKYGRHCWYIDPKDLKGW